MVDLSSSLYSKRLSQGKLWGESRWIKQLWSCRVCNGKLMTHRISRDKWWKFLAMDWHWKGQQHHREVVQPALEVSEEKDGNYGNTVNSRKLWVQLKEFMCSRYPIKMDPSIPGRIFSGLPRWRPQAESIENPPLHVSPVSFFAGDTSSRLSILAVQVVFQ